MSSDHQRTGPTTPEGKARSSRNALRHGLLAKQILIGKESVATFTALLDLLIARWAPTDEVERGLIEEMAAAHWRIRRVWAMESEMLQEGMANQSARLHITRAAAAFGELASDPKLNLLHRYESRLHMMYQRSLHNLFMLRNAGVRNEYNNSFVSNENTDFDPSNIDELGPKTVDIAPKTAEKRTPRRLLPPGPDITPPPPHSPETAN